MSLNIAIHYYKNDFSDKWVEYCKKNNIKYQLIDCYDNNIIEIMRRFDILLWSWNLNDFSSSIIAKDIIFALEKMGKIVFPNFKTSYLYDNKMGQKYLLESIGNNISIPSYIFYTKNSAKKWINQTEFPKVFKLSSGAGALNVELCYNKHQANKLLNIAFGKGFSKINRTSWFKDKLKKFQEQPSKYNFKILIKSIGRLFIPTEHEKYMNNEKGYIYFQDFIPKNTFDLRIIIINNKAIGIKRLCRKDDFRASGSEKIIYDKNQIDIKSIKIAFNVSKKLNFQCMAYDFVYGVDNQPLIVEMSYHFSATAYDKCQGYWDENLNWYNEPINPQNMIIQSILNKIK